MNPRHTQPTNNSQQYSTPASTTHKHTGGCNCAYKKAPTTSAQQYPIFMPSAPKIGLSPASGRNPYYDPRMRASPENIQKMNVPNVRK